ncbi:MAG: enhanced serine sensitivity protein SseB C-terminal domain-containing protein [Planctomycetes bacterium]|nr:enhanced serine sensitivity protein SseB C-terminal domain-containing protein [Planctomycetota bacterium]
MLKSKISDVLSRQPTVVRAYLCRVRYQAEGEDSVALAVSGPEDLIVVDEIGKVFWATFGRECFLDIMFIGSDQESRLDQVCRPFYSAG